MPSSFAFVHEPISSRSSQPITSARMKPRWKSVWMRPAHSGALDPARNVHARVSFSPVVKYVRRPSRWYALRTIVASAPSPRPSASSISERSFSSSWAASASICTLIPMTSISAFTPAGHISARTRSTSAGMRSSSFSPTFTTARTGLLVSRKCGARASRSSFDRLER